MCLHYSLEPKKRQVACNFSSPANKQPINKDASCVVDNKTHQSNYLEAISNRNPSVSKDFLENLEKRTLNKNESLKAINSNSNVTNTDSLLPISCDKAVSSLWENIKDDSSDVEEREPCSSADEAPKRTFANCLSDRDWLNEFEYLFAAGLFDELKETLQHAYNKNESPFDFVLFIMTFAEHDIFSGKKSLVHIALSEFESWLENENKKMVEMGQEVLTTTRQQKDNAMEIVVTSKLLYFETIKRLFNLDCADNGYLEKHIRYLLHTGRRYKEVCLSPIP